MTDDNIDLGTARIRLRAIESRLAALPAWKRGSREYTRLENEARQLRDLIAGLKLRLKYIVPESTGPLARYRLEIPRGGDPS
jgi:hypothetical protein